ncbi:MAG: DnaJ domain-containing protein, partial [Acidobacteriota bacterium]
ELDVATSLSQEMIIEGIRRIPESEQFTELLGDLSEKPTLTRDPMSSGSLRLLKDAVGLISQIDGKTSLRDLLQTGSIPGSASAKILYSLLFAGLIEMRPVPAETAEESSGIRRARAGEASEDRRVEDRRSGERRSEGRREEDRRLEERRAADRKAAGYLYDFRSSAPLRKILEIPGKAAPESPPEVVETRRKESFETQRELVLEMHRQLDWLSHYDLLGVSRHATATEIEEAYRRRSRLFDPSLKAHPELVDCWRQLTVLAKWLRVAHGVLSNPESRLAYDRKISATPAPPPDGGQTA